MPLDEAPNLVSLLGALEREVISELYDRLSHDGFDGLTPASAPVFQFVRPGGSSVSELARRALSSEAAVHEQARALEAAGYARLGEENGEPTVELSARGREAAALGQRVLAEIEARWRARLGRGDFDNFYGAAARLALAGRR